MSKFDIEQFFLDAEEKFVCDFKFSEFDNKQEIINLVKKNYILREACEFKKEMFVCSDEFFEEKLGKMVYYILLVSFLYAEYKYKLTFEQNDFDGLSVIDERLAVIVNICKELHLEDFRFSYMIVYEPICKEDFERQLVMHLEEICFEEEEGCNI